MFVSRKILAVLGILVLAGAGIALAVEKPGYGLEDRGDWADTTDDSINISSQGYVHNPNSFGLNISSLNIAYRLKMNGVELAKGGKEGLNIAAEDNNTLEVQTELDPEKVPEWWVSHMNNNEVSKLEVPLTADLTVLGKPISVDGITYTDSIETDLESKMDNAVSQVKGTYSWSPTSAEISETEIEIVDGSAEFGKVTEETTPLLVTFEVRNPNSYPIPAPQFNGELNMNSIQVAEWQANEVTVTKAPENGVIAPGETQDVKLKVDMSNERIDDWFVSHADQMERSEGEINLRLGFDIAGQTFEIPRNGGLSCDFSFQTGILVDGQESDSEFSGCEEESLGIGFGGSDSNNSSDGSDSLLGDGSENNSSDSGGLTDSIL
jgi:LEA14-like dessication related protein